MMMRIELERKALEMDRTINSSSLSEFKLELSSGLRAGLRQHPIKLPVGSPTQPHLPHPHLSSAARLYGRRLHMHRAPRNGVEKPQRQAERGRAGVRLAGNYFAVESTSVFQLSSG